jgi:hypothetical protein
VNDESSDKATGAVDQQERLDAYVAIATRHPESSETTRQAPHFRYFGESGEDMVRSAWRHAEPGRNALAPDDTVGGNNDVGPYPMQP